jgi:hypothetical protein
MAPGEEAGGSGGSQGRLAVHNDDLREHEGQEKEEPGRLPQVPSGPGGRWLRKGSPESDAVWERAARITRDLLAEGQNSAPVMEEARSAEDWAKVKDKKESEYGGSETFADPAHHSYPLTKDGKPSQERVRAAWSYIHHPKNSAKYGDGGAGVKKRIASFARKHFPDMNLEGHDEKSQHSERGGIPEPARELDMRQPPATGD